ncbi:MAG TPA: hypothetical protein V6D06_12220 [Trichocoleus sp.]
MQYLRQSLLTICICLYAFLAVTLGLSFWVGRTDESAAVFYHPELTMDSIEAIEAVENTLTAAWAESQLEVDSASCEGQGCL